MLNRPAIVRLFATICLLMVLACPGWAGNITPVIGNSIMGGTDIVSDPLSPILMPDPIFVYQPDRSWISAHASGLKSTTYARTSAQTYVDRDGVLRIASANVPAIENGYIMLEGAATSYYWQPYTESGGAITAIEVPVTRTVTLPSTGDYILWIDGNARLSVTVAANTAAGSGWGTLTESGSLKLSITKAGTVDVAVSDGAANDIVQLTTGVVKTSYIPTPTSTPVTRTTSTSDTSGNGLQVDLTPEMIDCFGNGGSGSGIGTLIQWVYLPWDSDGVVSGALSILDPDNSSYRGFLAQYSGGAWRFPYINDGLGGVSGPTGHTTIGLYALVYQWDASILKYRCGRLSEASVLWGNYGDYRGFFPIHSSNKLRWFYGGTIPLGIGGCALYNTILTDDEIIRAAQALQ